MKRKITMITLWALVLTLVVGSLVYGQQRQRAPWEERSPGIGKVVPDVMIYNQKLQQVSLSSLYKGNYLYLQWGGCT
ncbi:MAG: hypothetical protein ACERK6_12485 [Candidatus Aminicenantaceae bacterium]